MCVNYGSPDPQQMRAYFRAAPNPFQTWKAEIWNHYDAPFIVARNGERQALLGEYGLVPKDKQPPGVKLTTMNARAESIGERRSYKKPWMLSQLCLVPMACFYEPCYESGRAARWGIRLANDGPFAVAGTWAQWNIDRENPRHSFTQITINADEHPLMRRFHRPGDEKRSLVILRPEEYDEWLNCRNPEMARTFLRPYPAALMVGKPRPLPPRVKT